MTKRRAATTRLLPGQTSIDRTTPTWRADVAAYVLDWSTRLHDGRLVRRRTQGPTKGECRARARRTAERLLTTSADSTWGPGDAITAYIERETVPRIEQAELAPNSVSRYLLVARLLAGRCDSAEHQHRETLRGYSILDAAKTKRLVAVLQDIARTHGRETAHQSRSVLSKYVLDPLADHEEIIAANPLRGRQIDLHSEHKGNGGQRDTEKALSHAEYWQIVDNLLERGTDAPTDPNKPRPKHPARNSRYSPAKWRCARDLILLQAGTGLRASEATSLRWAEVEDDGETMIVPVPAERSKTRAPRRAAVVGEIAAHLRQRHTERPDDVYVVSAPADGGKIWEPRARDKATSALYVEMADTLGIELLRRSFRGHGWRTTLNSLTADSVPVEVRAALLGHTEQVNRAHYLDLTDLTSVARAMARKPHLRAV
ncbi:tyrosine-type recombinase/integrase [Intrasporangium sp.]|uniref:tyrosine-type recombinase/integrase n=1 Tax=Intrasporangium sp. TaxID=1925024 RepID=UPI002649DEEF|nr:tyrosine-type recombinase/integrase [Intrasporangium sp.]